MLALRIPLAVLFVVVMLFSASQCVASCTALDCKAPPPPCHQHHGHETSKACPQDLNLAVVDRVHVTQDAAYGMAPDVAIAPLFAGVERPVLFAFSPPNISVGSSRILRI
jgi:hypothetical protein